MKEFYNSSGFIIAFLLSCVCVSAIFGEKFLNKFLILVLVSQLLINSKTFVDVFNKLTNDTILKQKNLDKYVDGTLRT